MSRGSNAPRSCGPVAEPASVSLPVLPQRGPNLPRKSRMGKKRAAVLIGVHVLMAAHIVQWLIHKKTLSPIEPSESMATLELGQLNAGFIVFSLALIATLVFGRYFCGWACHVVALQDLCAHWMNKLGVRPKPFRSKLPLYWSLLLALYMFVWPVFKREALFPLLAYAKMSRPEWLKPVAEFPKAGLQPHFIVEDFWATFAPPLVAIPFLLVCGFATVYVLGSKAFCTYGCPYGAFFAPLDRLSIGRIVVSDACNHCGHCTAACTSNVRVHQEVRDFGMVMDPGCMKCMDCVSVCPNDALAFKFAKPSVLTRPRTPEARAGAIDRPPGDLAWWEELWVFAAGLVIFASLRNFLETVPLLMAAGLAMILAFAAWKLTRLVLDPSVRLQNLQLRIKGRMTAAGVVFAASTVLSLGVTAWSGWVRASRWYADQLDAKVAIPAEVVYATGYTPPHDLAAQAQAAREAYARTLPRRDGGWGWQPKPDVYIRLSWLAAVEGNLDEGERWLRRAFEIAEPDEHLVRSLEQIRALRGDTIQQAIETYKAILERYPDLHGSRVRLALLMGTAGDLANCEAQAEYVIAGVTRRPTPVQLVGATEVLLALGKGPRAVEALEAGVTAHPEAAIVKAALGRTLYLTGNQPRGIEMAEAASALEPDNPQYLMILAQMYAETGRVEDLARIEAKLTALGVQVP